MSFETAKNDRQPRGASARIAGGLLGATLCVLGASGILSSQAAAADAARRPRRATTARCTRGWTRTAGQYARVADVQGTFAFNQDGVSPNDELFNVFGTTLDLACALSPTPELVADRGRRGQLLRERGRRHQEDLHRRRARAVEGVERPNPHGVLLRDGGGPAARPRSWASRCRPWSSMADLEEGVNTVTAYGADGFGKPLPLQLRARPQRAARVPGQRRGASRTPVGSSLQLWMPETVARYFTRNIVDIELTREDAEPEVPRGQTPMYRNKVNIMNSLRRVRVRGRRRDHVRGRGRRPGQPHRRHRVLVRRRRRRGPSCETDRRHRRQVGELGSSPTSFDEAGDYRMTVRARTADGVVSPLEATLTFQVIEA